MPGEPIRLDRQLGARTGEDEAVVDFGRCQSFTDIIQTLIELHRAGKQIPTSGEPMSAPEVAIRIDKAIDAVRQAGFIRDELRTDGTRLSTEEVGQVDRILADHQITRQSGLRRKIVDIISSGNIDCGGVYFRGLDQLSNRGDYNPLWKLSDREFAERFPEDQWSTMPDLSDDDVKQIEARWGRLRQAREGAAVDGARAEQYDWEKTLQQRTWQETAVARPTIVDNTTHQIALAGVLSDEKKAQERLRATRFGDHIQMPVRLGKPYSLAQRVETILTSLRGIVEIKSGLAENTFVTKGENRTVIARTLIVPREGQANVRLTIISEEAQEKGPLGDALEDTVRLIGIVVESGDEAWLKKAEDVLRKQLGLEFRLTKKPA